MLPRQQCQTFGTEHAKAGPRIEWLYVINLDRRPDRWAEMRHELTHILNSSGAALATMTLRHPAVDARRLRQPPAKDDDVDPFYTLRDQLFVEPQPQAMPDRLELDRLIQMSQPEIAVARSHIDVWRTVAKGEHSHVLVLEDDVWFRRGFARHLDEAWAELEADGDNTTLPDILYLSYKEIRHGAPKTFLSRNVFRPERGLWFLSGYVLSREGAGRLLRRLPCRGPVDLWMNYQFSMLDVRATRRSLISQRRDGDSTNVYSILPVLAKIGVITSEGASLFHTRPSERPVFAFGAKGSGLSSLAMALSMLGYRCCSDLTNLPDAESKALLSGRLDRVFDAYVNIGSLAGRALELRRQYPRAKFIVTADGIGAVGDVAPAILSAIDGVDAAVLCSDAVDKWQVVCEHLKCAPPFGSFPKIADLGQRRLLGLERSLSVRGKKLRRDKSPWIAESRQKWQGIRANCGDWTPSTDGGRVSVDDRFEALDTNRWLLREDTFPGNVALFRPSNVEFRAGAGAALVVRRQSLGVRNYSAASISSCDRYLFGRFEAVIQPTRVAGVVTGFFLHRDSPRQEIDVEISGNHSNRLLVNVFFNPGDEGARLDYGYRGAPSHVDLGFDASESPHRFAIEWSPCEIRWLVDDRIVHRRVDWDPTPIPHLPMTLHVNTWPCRSRELAGRLSIHLLPATTIVRSIAIEASRVASR